MVGNGGVGAGAVSEYEAKRLQRMQQNQQLLQSLGILLAPRERKRRVSTRDENAAPIEPRRSTRLQPDAVEPTTLLDLDSVPRRPRRTDEPTVKRVKQPTAEEKLLLATGKLSRTSSRLLDMEYGTFHDHWLGKQIWPKGMTPIMEAMCPLHIPVYFHRRVQQWRNGVVLFVHVTDAAGLAATFTEVPSTTTTPGATAAPEAVHFRWFSENRQTDWSPAIVRLQTAERGDRALWLDGAAPPPSTTNTATPPEPMVLFVRHVDGPYVYCGHIGYLGHLRESSPLEFRWQLLDLGKIQWNSIKQLLTNPDRKADDAVVLP